VLSSLKEIRRSKFNDTVYSPSPAFELERKECKKFTNNDLAARMKICDSYFSFTCKTKNTKENSTFLPNDSIIPEQKKRNVIFNISFG
jgi:hypothetical protein